MFNDLNNQNAQNKPAVDDIFAETDKHAPGVYSNSSQEIDAHRVGVVSNNEALLNMGVEDQAKQDKLFKIFLILIIVAILIVGGYVAYTKFFAPNNSDITNNIPAPVKSNPDETATPETPSADSNNITETIDLDPLTNEPPIVAEINPSSTEAIITPVVITLDSDSDGLTDDEEETSGTNVNLLDSDNDGLSDYEELKIYKTNPLNKDTDGDTYLDGAEVKSGYNPNGAGKLPGAPAV